MNFERDVAARVLTKLASLRTLFRSGETPVFEHEQFRSDDNPTRNPGQDWANQERRDSTAGAV